MKPPAENLTQSLLVAPSMIPAIGVVQHYSSSTKKKFRNAFVAIRRLVPLQPQIKPPPRQPLVTLRISTQGAQFSSPCFCKHLFSLFFILFTFQNMLWSVTAPPTRAVWCCFKSLRRCKESLNLMFLISSASLGRSLGHWPPFDMGEASPRALHSFVSAPCGLVEFPWIGSRKPFPFGLCFALTVNKSKNQS